MKMVKGRFLPALRNLLSHFFIYKDDRINHWLSRVWLIALFFIGMVNWSVFYNCGDLPLAIADWADISTPRLITLADAVNRGLLPLHTASPDGVKGVSDRFLSIPDLILSPQILLLRVVDPGLFALINLLLLYAVGFAGLLIFRKNQRIGLVAFSLLFWVFNFNGHIVAHLSIGHITWMAYFLMPFFVLLIGDLFKGGKVWPWVLKFSLLQTLIFLQGGFHFFVWILIFTLLIALFSKNTRKRALFGAVSSILLSSFRILPAILLSQELRLAFLGGFTTFNDLLRGLLVLVEPGQIFTQFSRLTPYIGWWEYDYFIGWGGVIWIIIVIYLGFRKNEFSAASSQMTWFLNGIFWPCLIFAVISIGRLYQPVFLLQIPLLNGERVASRFLLLPFCFSHVCYSIYHPAPG